MTYPPKVVEILTKLKLFLTEERTKNEFRTSPQDFIRRGGKLSFSLYALLGISLLKNSLSVELFNLLSINQFPVISKSAYSQGRYKLQAAFYLAWNRLLLRLVYSSAPPLPSAQGVGLHQWRGYFLEAIDGTSLMLPQTNVLANYFGVHKSGLPPSGLPPSGLPVGETQVVETVMARCLVRADLLNGYVLQSEVFKTTLGELSVCKTWLPHLHSHSITLFDRGFASAALFAYLTMHQKPFVCRLKIGFNKVVNEFVTSPLTDTEVCFSIRKTEVFGSQSIETEQENPLPTEIHTMTSIKKGSKVQVRLVKVLLSTGEIEVLATNLMDNNAITTADVGELYGKRWGIETVINRLKNQLLMMVFSGLKPQAILQDIYATIFTYNLHQLLINQAQEIVSEYVKADKQREKPACKHDQQVNKNVALGVLKPKIITLFLVQEPVRIIEELLDYMVKNKIPIKPDKQRPPRQKSVARRRNLSTQYNYRKAI